MKYLIHIYRFRDYPPTQPPPWLGKLTAAAHKQNPKVFRTWRYNRVLNLKLNLISWKIGVDLPHRPTGDRSLAYNLQVGPLIISRHKYWTHLDPPKAATYAHGEAILPKGPYIGAL